MAKEIVLKNQSQIEDAVKAAEEVDLNALFQTANSMLRIYGDFAKSLGTIERDNKKAYQGILYLGACAPQFMEIIAKRAPVDELGIFVKMMSRLFSLAPKLDKLMELPPEEKITVGKELIEIADSFDKLIAQMGAVKK